MHYVYILQSAIRPDQTYVGSTQDLRVRLEQHNAGKSTRTNKFRPWNLAVYIALREKNLAESLERYLKTGSGRAFAKRHFSISTT